MHIVSTVSRKLHIACWHYGREKVIGMKKQLDGAGIANQNAALCQASGEALVLSTEIWPTVTARI